MDKEIESLKSKYSYKNTSLPEGNFIDISIQVPITKEVKSYGKEKLDFFLKSIYQESMEISKLQTSQIGNDEIKYGYNLQILLSVTRPMMIYLGIILYKRLIRGRILETNSFKENLKPRLFAFGITFTYYFSYVFIYCLMNDSVCYSRKNYVMKEIMGTGNDQLYEEYVNFKRKYKIDT